MPSRPELDTTASTGGRNTTTVASDEQIAHYDQYGFFVVERAFDEEAMADLAEALALPRDDVVAPRPDHEFVRRFCGHPLLAGLVRDVLGPDAHVAHHEAVVRGSLDDHVHEFCPRSPSSGTTHPSGTTHRLSCWVALTDSDPGSGCLQIVCGHHNTTTDSTAAETAEPSTVLDVSLRTGSVVVMCSLTPTRTLANAARRPTAAFVVDYVGEPVIDLDGRAPRFAVVRRGQLVSPA